MIWERCDPKTGSGPIRTRFISWHLTVIVLALVGTLLGEALMVTRPSGMATSPIDADANYSYNYEWFRIRHDAVLTLNAQIKDAQTQIDQFKANIGPRDKWHRGDREGLLRLNTTLLSLKNERVGQAVEFNSRSRMINPAIFTGTSTPAVIEVEDE